MTIETLDFSGRVREHGYSVAENIVDNATVLSLRESVAEILEAGDSMERDRKGYGLRHLLNRIPLVRKVADSSEMLSIAESVLGPGTKPIKGTFFDKVPTANWKVHWHQDFTIAVKDHSDAPGFGPWTVKDDVLHVQPPREVMENILALRLHLDDSHADNGALRVLPGSHRMGKMTSSEIDQVLKENEAETCMVRAGGVLVMRPLLLHCSGPATTPSHRRVIHLEYSAMGLPGSLEWYEA